MFFSDIMNKVKTKNKQYIHFFKGDMKMELKKLEHRLTVCKVGSVSDIDLDQDFYFIAKTD